MKLDYSAFGNVIVMDSTYKKNAYNKPLVIVVGVNHHFRTVAFGFGLLVDETVDTYVWFLKCFLESMSYKKPESIITDSDPAMRKAIRKELRECNHRLCSWHLAQNAQKRLRYDDRVQAWAKCMRLKQSHEAFEEQWAEFVMKFGLQDHRWTTQMYNRKHMWAEAFFRGKFFANMRSNQRCEAMNSYLKHFLEVRMKLYHFVMQIDRAVARMRYIESYDDYLTLHSSPPLTTHIKCIEKMAASCLTHNSFMMFRAEMDKEKYLTIVNTTAFLDHKDYAIAKYGCTNKSWTVKSRDADNHITCSCLGFETDGIPCRHIFAVLKAEMLDHIPAMLILDRWRRDAKNTMPRVRMVGFEDEDSVKNARYGAMTSLCNKLCYYATENDELFGMGSQAVAKIIASMGQKLSDLHIPATEDEVHASSSTFIRDPKVVQSKGCRPNIPLEKDHSSQAKEKRKCGRCKERGHNSRRCPQRNVFESQKSTGKRPEHDSDSASLYDEDVADL